MTEKTVTGKVRLETYDLNLDWDHLSALVQYFQANPEGTVIKVVIEGQVFDA